MTKFPSYWKRRRPLLPALCAIVVSTLCILTGIMVPVSILLGIWLLSGQWLWTAVVLAGICWYLHKLSEPLEAYLDAQDKQQ